MLSVRLHSMRLERKTLTAQLTDTVTSLALSTMGIPPPTGASVNISCEFVRPAGKEGEDLYSIGEVVKLGQLVLWSIRIMCWKLKRGVQAGQQRSRK